MSENPELNQTLDDIVAEVLGLLTDQAVEYIPESDRYYVITRHINRALRSVATEAEWSWYASTENVGTAVVGQQAVNLRSTLRPRIINDDAVRLCRPGTDYPEVWAYWYPRDAIHKVPDRAQLYVAHTNSLLEFSRPFRSTEAGLEIHVPVMREPKMFRLPERPEDPTSPIPAGNTQVPAEIREQPVDFAWPDLIALKAAYFYAQTNPIMQPRVQTLEANYDDLMYKLKDRDSRNTEAPFLNTYYVPVDGSIMHGSIPSHTPHSDWGWGG